MAKIILVIPKEDIEEVIHLLRYAMCEEPTSDDVWTLLMPFCEEHSSIKFNGREEEFLKYSSKKSKIMKKIPFYEAFDLYIKGQVAKCQRAYAPFGNKDKTPEDRYYGDGVEFENGYKLISYGGGCSGEDCNNSFIIDNEDNLIATNNW